MKQIDLSALPKLKNGNSKKVDWKNAIGKDINFTYDDICGTVKIIDHDYKNNTNSKVTVRYNNKTETMTTDAFLKAQFGTLLNKITSDFKVNIGDVFADDKRNIVIINREKRKYKKQYKKYYQYKCNVCGYSNGWIEERSLIKVNVGCSCCYGWTVVEGINDIPTTTPWLTKFFQGGLEEAKSYTYGSNKKLNFICPDCGKVQEKAKPINRIYKWRSCGCTCGGGFSFPEKFMVSVLEQLKLKFDVQYSPEWIGRKRFDFHLPDYSLIIETDGGINHDDYNPYDKNYDSSVDEWKDEQAKKQGIHVIRIDARDSNPDCLRKNIIKELNQYFSLENIDWNLCDKQAQKNLVKEVCEYFEANKPIKLDETAKYFHMSVPTVRKYIKNGVKFNWCTFNVDDFIKSPRIITNINRWHKKVEVYKNNLYIDTFESKKKLIKNSVERFGVQLSEACIIDVLRGRQKHHRGYTFKYANRKDNKLCM